MKNLAAFAAAFVVGAVLSGGLEAATTSAKSTDQPINVSSDRFVADLNGKTGTFVGNVLVTQGDIKMRANQVRITSVNGKADRVTATGNVVVDSPASGTATGDVGVYSVGPRTVLMSGNVVLKRARDVMRGAQLTVNLVTGQATLGAGAKGTPGAPQGRVQGVFNPTQDQSQSPPQPQAGAPR
ncbi:MAG: lipopolysaccharide transport periplasmic protein LptA [Alphaproteobacteria bacterium]|nr:lipopolysaccharide transport periplasmic protein LptA [Alphaproteobacteria bacterium]